MPGVSVPALQILRPPGRLLALGVDLAELRPDQIWESAKSLRRTVANLRVPTYQDGAPILGKDPRVPGLFQAVTSNGYTLGPLVGRITADLVDRDATDRDVRVFSVARFSDAAAGAPVSAPQ